MSGQLCVDPSDGVPLVILLVTLIVGVVCAVLYLRGDA